MSARVSRAEVEAVARTLAEVAARRSVDGARAWAIRAGSPTYGRGWLLVEIGEHGGQSTVAMLGDTAREAATSLRAMLAALTLAGAA